MILDMGKGKKKTGKTKKREVFEEIVKPSQTAGPNEEDNEEFNFGGLPSRDLKKNLGCG